MTEDQLLANVLDDANELGLYAFHAYDSRKTTGAGFPDLVITGRTVVFVELKSWSGELSAGQVRWKYKLQAAGQDWRLWRPGDWADGSIRAQLIWLAS